MYRRLLRYLRPHAWWMAGTVVASFVAAAGAGATPEVTGEDARGALAIALACIASVQSGRPVRLDEVEKP